MSDRIAKEYPETENAIMLTVYTKSPQKWLLIDRETGEVYEGSDLGVWKKLMSRNQHENTLVSPVGLEPTLNKF